MEEEPWETVFEGDTELDREGMELIVGVGGMGVRDGGVGGGVDVEAGDTRGASGVGDLDFTLVIAAPGLEDGPAGAGVVDGMGEDPKVLEGDEEREGLREGEIVPLAVAEGGLNKVAISAGLRARL